jgi:uncharacterized membrane protein
VRMKLAVAAQMTIRISGLLGIGLGVVVWTGKGDELISLHEFLGLVLVLALWLLSFLAARSRVSIGLVVLAIIWGLVAAVLGEMQVNLLTDEWHWIVQVIHLLIGLGAIGLGEWLARAIKATPGARAARAA